MRVEKSDQVFNLMNTNGRRSDVINAYTIYMEILNDLGNIDGDFTFSNFPNSFKQFLFYEEAIKRSPEVFQKHTNYDWVKQKLNEEAYSSAFYDRDVENMKKLSEGKKFLKNLDNGVEDRARHYTSNLVKVGFTYYDRKITPVGFAFVEGKDITRDNFEELLPIDNVNLIFLRQLLKLRIYSPDYARYYSPMMMCIYLLRKKKLISISDLQLAISVINPSKPAEADLLLEHINSQSLDKFEQDYISYIDTPEMDKIKNLAIPMTSKEFDEYFKNRKSKVKEYYEFYKLLVKFRNNSNSNNLLALYKLYEGSKSKIDKAFGHDKSIFNFDKKNPSDLKTFKDLNKDHVFLSEGNINEIIYSSFMSSKRHDTVKEYSDTLLRLLSVTGIIHFTNGFASLKFNDLWDTIFDNIDIKEYIFGHSTKEEYKAYEENINSDFYNHRTISSIFSLEKAKVTSATSRIVNLYGASSIEAAKDKIKDKLKDEFIEFIEKEFPKEKILKLLELILNRKNDEEIRKIVGSKAAVPTIYEYLVGIAWYYISEKEYDVLSSFRLTMNANFLPETHAGGGDGDIVIEYEDIVVMLEATLMNKNAQKRGEWEPVLRHAANLSIDSDPKKVFTFFIADEFDDNTINIWRAVASVPLKSSKEVKTKGFVARNVTIMPLNTREIISILNNSNKHLSIIKSVEKSFSSLSQDFDIEWRDKVLKEII